MTLLKAVLNLVVLFIGFALASGALRDRRRGFYPVWLWIAELIVGCIISAYGFTVWFVH